MADEVLGSAGYNTDRLRSLRLRRRLRSVLSLTLLLLIAGGALFGTANYFARLPQERSNFSDSWNQRAYRGARDFFVALTGTVAAPEADPTATKLPIVELVVTGARIDALNSNLPESGDQFQKALVKLDGKVRKAKVKYRGDSFNHWLYPYKSWRIRLTEARNYKGRTTYNLNLPRTPTQFGDELGYMLGRKFGGMLVPNTELVHFRLNRQFNGLRMMIEQIAPSFPIHHGLKAGTIFVGDIDTRHIYGKLKPKHLFKQVDAWRIEDLDTDVGVADQRQIPPQLVELIRTLNANLSPYERKRQLEQLIDVNAYLRMMAFLELVGSWHIDDIHNQRMYLNPDTGLLTPVLWDPVAYIWGATGAFDLASNLLFARLLEVPSFRKRKNEYIWEGLRNVFSPAELDKEVDSYVEKTKQEIDASIYRVASRRMKIGMISAAEWRNNVAELKAIYRKRSDTLRAIIPVTSVKARTERVSGLTNVEVQVYGKGDYLLESVTIEFSGRTTNPPVLKRLGLENIGQPILSGMESVTGKAVTPTKFQFELNDVLTGNRILQSKRLHGQPARYTYALSNVPDGPIKVTYLGRDPVSHRPLTVEHVEKLGPAGKGFWDHDRFGKRPEKIIDGSVEFTSPLVAVNEDVVIRGGTKITLGPQASIVVRGGALRIEGTGNKPVLIEGQRDEVTWGTLAVQDSIFDIRGLKLSGGAFAFVKGAYYSAPIVIRNSRGQITDSTFSKTRISAEKSELKVTQSNFAGYSPFITEDQSTVTKTNLTESSLSPKIRATPGKALGTPGRVEREFKYTLNTFAGLATKDVAHTVNAALNSRVTDAIGWKAPALFGKPYGVSTVQEAVCYVDYYFDSPEQINLQRDATYRMRYRFKDCNRFLSHVEHPKIQEFWPYRVEMQTKVNREDLGGGIFQVEESRLEYRWQSKPFSRALPPPPPPWSFESMLPVAQTGIVLGNLSTPGKALLDYHAKFGDTELTMIPQFVIMTERSRQHLTMKTEYGTGPNPDQAFIITFDRSTVMPFSKVATCKQRCRELDNEKNGAVTFGELEIEFERNVSTGLDEKLASSTPGPEQERLKAAKEGFLVDQAIILDTIGRSLANKGITIAISKGSKGGVAARSVATGSDKFQ